MVSIMSNLVAIMDSKRLGYHESFDTKVKKYMNELRMHASTSIYTDYQRTFSIHTSICDGNP